MSALPLFVYDRLADEEVYVGVVGKRVEARPARVKGYRLVRGEQYAYLVPDKDAEAEGFLISDVVEPDYWVLDDYQRTDHGLFVRQKVSVVVEDREIEAYAYIGGSMLAAPREPPA